VSRRSIVAGLVGCLASAASAATNIYPAEPVTGQDFVVELTTFASCSPQDAKAQVSGTTIFLDYTSDTAGCDFAVLPPRPPLAFVVRASSAGTYDLVDRAFSGGTSTSRPDGQVTIKAAGSKARPSFSLAGLWWVPSQPGWALNISEGDSGQLFLVWYTYSSSDSTSATGNPFWFFASGGQWNDGNRFTGALSVGYGSPTTRAFDASKGSVTTFGLATVVVQSPDTITFDVEPKRAAGYPANLQLTRYRF
jgi:hypothetical protein